MSSVVVTGSFDDLRLRHVRFLEEASKLGNVQALLWSDETTRSLEGNCPKFPLAERLYVLQAIRYVSAVSVVAEPRARDTIPPVDGQWNNPHLLVGWNNPHLLVGWNSPPVGQLKIWVADEASATPQQRAYYESHGLAYHVVSDEDLKGFPSVRVDSEDEPPSRKKVVVTGCFDWLHSGHVRFFEEASGLGDLYVVAGSDVNVRLLKGEGHPLFPQDERRYMIQSVRYVKQTLISTGHGWMDAEPEIELIKPDLYVVNEDGDKPEKHEFCQARGIQYVVLKRAPKEGLPRRQSTDLRGF